MKSLRLDYTGYRWLTGGDWLVEWQIVAGLIGVGIVIGFVIRSSLGFLLKIAVVVVALAVFHVVSPDGIPDMIRQGMDWVYDLLSSQAKDVLPTR